MSFENKQPSINTSDIIILCGGPGSRLRSVISDRPKSLAPVTKRPFLAILLEQVKSAGFKRVVLCTGYMADMIKKEFGNQYHGMTLAYSKEDDLLGTGGALKNALPLILSETIMVMNGDSFIDMDLNAFFCWFAEKKYDAAMVLKKVNDTSRYGSVTFDTNGLITMFYEKKVVIRPGWINAGVYMFNKTIAESIPENRFFSLENNLLPALAGTNLYGYRSEGKFIDIGLPSTFADANRFFKHLRNESLKDHTNTMVK